jgi:ribosomal protein S18 acetylase RimI-like enzyme
VLVVGIKEKRKVTIRRMTSKDIGAIIDFDRKVSKGQSHVTYRDMLTNKMGGALDFSLVSEVEGKVIGFIVAQLMYLGMPFTEVCVIQGIVVDPEYRRLGIGSQLVEALMNSCCEKQINTIRALVAEDDTEIRHFAEQLGFHRSPIINYDRSFEIE